MAINVNPGSPSRHVSTFTSSGNFVVPQGSTLAFVSIHSATGGGGAISAQGANRYSSGGGAGGQGIISGAFVEVIPGGTSTVTIGAGGTSPGGTGGTTIFDGALTSTGSGGGGAGNPQQGRYSTGVAGTTGSAAVAATGTTTLTALSPSASALVRTKTISSQTTGASAGGAQGSRYASGGVGASGIVHIYL